MKSTRLAERQAEQSEEFQAYVDMDRQAAPSPLVDGGQTEES